MSDENNQPQTPPPPIPNYPGYPPGYNPYPQPYPWGPQFAPPAPTLPPIPNYPAPPAPKPEPAKAENPEDGYIPKRIAAIEAYKHVRQQRTMGFGLLLSPFLISIAGVFHPFAGIAAAALAAMGSVFFIYRAQGEMRRLEAKYGIDPKAAR